MSLKLTLKPQEKIIIGGAVIKNGASTSHFSVENNVPVLRQTDIITEAEATTPCRRIYLAIQLMYIDGEKRADILPIYHDLVTELLEAVPSMKDLISQTSEYMVDGKYYQALKQAKKLMTYEEELLRNVSKTD
ncbi:MAG TPA: flagellar biosynthesis repressor FlbT [Desulfuromonadaceae bacterium]